MKTWGNTFPGRGKCKGPEVAAHLFVMRNSEEAVWLVKS